MVFEPVSRTPPTRIPRRLKAGSMMRSASSASLASVCARPSAVRNSGSIFGRTASARRGADVHAGGLGLARPAPMNGVVGVGVLALDGHRSHVAAGGDLLVAQHR